MQNTRLEKIAEEMVRFREDTFRLVERKGKLYNADDLVLTPAEEEKVLEAKSLMEIPGISFFTLGQIYVGAQVPYSFLDQYCGEVGDEHFLTFTLPSPFCQELDVNEDGAAVGTWGDKLHALPTESLPEFTRFMTEQVLTRDLKACGITFTDMMLYDRVLLHKGSQPSNDIRMPVRVFSTYNSRLLAAPVEDFVTGGIQFIPKPVPVLMQKRIQDVVRAKALSKTN